MRAASSLSGRAALQQLAALLRSSSSMRQSSSWGSNSASSGRRGAGGSSSRRTQAPPPRPRRQQRRAPSAAARGLQQYLVTCHPGLQEVTADELRQPHLQLAHGLSDVSVLAPGRVSFSAPSAAGGYAAALCLHSATRVLQLVHEQVLDPRQPAGDTVYEATREAADWGAQLAPGQTLGVHCLHFFNNSNCTNSQLVVRRVRDAVCDAVREARGVRPAPPEGAPDLPLVFQMLNDNLQIFRDLGGGSLHRRGYRSGAAIHKAALNEAAAAGLLLLADWQREAQQPGVVLADPMAGSGTLLIEAALLATKTAPGLLRMSSSGSSSSSSSSNSGSNDADVAPPWPFLRWPDYEQPQWQAVVEAAQERAEAGRRRWREDGGRLLGNDMHARAVELAQQAAAAAGVSQALSMHTGACGDWRPAAPPHLVVCNPPWGVRLLGERDAGGDRAARNSSSRSGSRGSSRGGTTDGRGGTDDGDDELADAWQQLGRFIKCAAAPGAAAWVLSGNADATRFLGMRSCRKRAVSLGGVRATWLKYEVRGEQQQQQAGGGQAPGGGK